MIIKIPIKLLAAPRPRFANGHAYMPKNYQEQKKELKKILRRHSSPMKGAVYLSIEIRTKNKRMGDLDNYAKTILDAAEGVLFYNDIQISELRVKHYKKDIDLVRLSITPDYSSSELSYKEVKYE